MYIILNLNHEVEGFEKPTRKPLLPNPREDRGLNGAITRPWTEYESEVKTFPVANYWERGRRREHKAVKPYNEWRALKYPLCVCVYCVM